MLARFLTFLAILFGSACFFLLFALIFLNATVIACTRQADDTYTCNLQTLVLGRFPAFGREVADIVDVDIFDDGCFEGCSYRAEIITSAGGRVAVTEVYTDYNPVQKRVTELKSLLNGGQSSFEYNIEPLWWVAYLLGGLFLIEALVLTVTMGAGALRGYLANRDRL